MTNHSKFMDGCDMREIAIKTPTSSFGKVKPLKEGLVDKGGRNPATRITTRPPPPAPMRPASSRATATKDK